MTLAEVMEELRRRDIHLYFENGQLRCRAPTGALDREMRTAIAAHKNEFLAFLCSQRKAPRIEPVARDDVLPLSFGQERLWFLDRLDPGSAAYNIPLAIEIEGELNVSALERSFNELIRRHEILRTTYEMRDRQPVQRIGPGSTISLPVQDLRHLPETRRLGDALELARADARAPFDLGSGPMLRVRLLLMRSDRADYAAYVLVIVFHHIVTDDWSSVVFFKELGSLYSAFARGGHFQLAPMNIQYGDFAVAQRNWLQGPMLDDHLSYWRGKLDGATATLDLPKRRKRKGNEKGGAEFRFVIATSSCDGLRRLGRDFGATQFMILLATFDVLLYRYTGQRDICVGTVIANRNWIDTEGLLGFFTNTLVLRADLSEDPSFVEFLDQVRATTLEAQSHQDLPFERLVQALRPSNEIEGAQLFRAAIVFHKMGFEQVAFPGVKVRSLEGIKKRAAFEIVLHLTEEEGGLLGRFEYDDNAFDDDLIERMADHFEHLLESVASNPRIRIGALSMLSDAERNRVLVDWNDTARDYFEDYAVHELFEEQAMHSFDAVATVFGDQRLTYRELNARANQLARYLVRCGVGPETIIGICVERSLDMVVCLLAVLKAGGAYVPLDLDCPDERLDFMIADAKPVMVLTHRELQERLPRGVRTFCLDIDWPSVEGESKDNLGRRAASQNLAYVIYTSGSTGRPKGVAITHGGVVNYTQAILSKFPEGRPHLDFAFVSTFGADLGNTALYASLVGGGRLHVLGRDTVADPALIRAYIREHRIDVLKITPSHFDAIAHPAEAAGICPREALVFGGESLPSELARRAASANPQCRIFNHYGPTEATVGVLMLPLEDIGSDTTTMPLGRPIFNTRAFVVDSTFEPVPVGVAGELLIGGVGLARGYVGRPDLTAERFIPSPFGPPGDRLYRTGDLARYRTDGVIEFLGRIDHQVKIRGFRVELGEIETALSQIAEVRMSAVVADEGRAGGARLVAYVKAKEGARVTSEGLRAALRRSLPEYMTPSAFVMVDAFPLTRNGKIDRTALPAADFGARSTRRYVPPRTVTEESLCRIWAELLGVERVGVEDNFFQLGGHSLLAVQATARISHAMSISLPLRVFYEASSLSAVAESVDILTELRPREGSIVSMTADGLEEVEV